MKNGGSKKRKPPHDIKNASKTQKNSLNLIKNELPFFGKCFLEREHFFMFLPYILVAYIRIREEILCNYGKKAMQKGKKDIDRSAVIVYNSSV